MYIYLKRNPVTEKNKLYYYYSEARETTPAAEKPIPRGLVEDGFGGQTG